MTELYLAHWGIKGQRWGFRRFQNQDGSLTPAGKARYHGGIQGGTKNSPRHQASEARKRATAEEKARQFEEAKKNALERGSAADIMKFKGHLTTTEMNNAWNRLEAERKLSEAAAKEIEKGKFSAKKAIAALDSAKDSAQKVFDAWNLIAKVHNSFNDENNQWQQIGQPSEKAKREKKEKEKKETIAKNERLAKAVKTGEITTGQFQELSKIKNNLSETDIDELIKKMSRNP